MASIAREADATSNARALYRIALKLGGSTSCAGVNGAFTGSNEPFEDGLGIVFHVVALAGQPARLYTDPIGPAGRRKRRSRRWSAGAVPKYLAAKRRALGSLGSDNLAGDGQIA